ncbi:MAG: nucleotide pyrophosphohydrolase [Armatimonadetes bacterium]|nr:nucleotide pyrophosphohydrolase [Armatimonadota bacterium]
MADNQLTLAALRQKVLAFRDARDWKQFHNPKDLALALSIEAAEILELFRFKKPEEIERELQGEARRALAHELADVLHFVLLLSHEAGIDLSQALFDKLELLEDRYPVELARGRRLKYTELRNGS